MALNILHCVKRPTVLDLDSGVTLANVIPGKIAAVNSSGNMIIAGNNSAATVGVFQVPATIPAYQSTGLLTTQINGAVGSPGGGTRVSVVAGAGAVIQSDQMTGTPAPATLLGANTDGTFKTYSSGDVVGICLAGADANGLYTIQLRM